MGLIRTILALAVVIFHSAPFLGFRGIGGVIAVEAFYVISGFYMALILTERYVGPNRIKAFYASRALRLYPIYFIVLGLTIALSIIWESRGLGNPLRVWFATAGHLDPITLFVLILSNLTFIGQDVLCFLNVGPKGSFDFYMNIKPEMKGSWYLIINQSWTLGLEITFYLLAPFLMRARTLMIVGLALWSFSLRNMAFEAGYDFDPWRYRFFPFELVFFLLGVLAYRAYVQFDRCVRALSSPRVEQAIVLLGWTAVSALLAYAVIFADLHGQLSTVRFVIWLTLALPLVFFATRSNRFDTAIGELSYPIYMCHFAFILFFPKSIEAFGFGYGETVAVLSIGFSMLLLWATRGIERYRHSFRISFAKGATN